MAGKASEDMTTDLNREDANRMVRQSIGAAARIIDEAVEKSRVEALRRGLEEIPRKLMKTEEPHLDPPSIKALPLEKLGIAVKLAEACRLPLADAQAAIEPCFPAPGDFKHGGFAGQGKVYGMWAGRWLHEMSKDELCEIIVNQERKRRAQSEAHAREVERLIDLLPGPRRPWWKWWGRA